jgi:UPF0755 protein
MGHRVTDLLSEQASPRGRGGRRRSSTAKRKTGCIAALVVLVLLLVGLWFGVTRLAGFLDDRFSEPEDYPGPGSGSVEVTVEPGASGTDIAEALEDANVVADASIFAKLVATDPQGSSIQPGTYEMREEMSSEGALKLLLGAESRVDNTITIPEGQTVDEIIARVAEESDISRKALRRAADQPGRLGLPDYAEGDLEGYLFPAQYDVPPGTTATEVLTMMVDRYREVTESAGIERRANQLGVDPHDLVTIASLVQAEAPAGSFEKVARVIYNRDDIGMKLQFDSTVHYAIGDTGGDVFTTEEERETDSPYNTYRYAGLPPGAIGAPGEDALEAALNPADGDWLYFVTVNLETGETLFEEDYDQHLANRDQLREWCETSDLC